MLSHFKLGFLSSLPYLGRFVSAQASGVLSDWLLNRPHLMSKPNIRRMTFSVALLGPALGLAIMGFLTDDLYACVAVMTMGNKKM